MPQPNDSYFARRRRKAARLEGGRMQVIGGKERPDALLAPGIDFIFEYAIQQDAGERVIDTQIDFVPGVATRLNGRKYIGENTAKELARLIGYVPADTAQKIQDDFDAYKAQVAAVFEKLDAVSADIQDVITVGSAPQQNTVSLETPPDAATLAAQADEKAAAEVATIQESEAAKTVAAENEEAQTNG